MNDPTPPARPHKVTVTDGQIVDVTPPAGPVPDDEIERALLRVADNVAKHEIQRGGWTADDKCFVVDLRESQREIDKVMADRLEAARQSWLAELEQHQHAHETALATALAARQAAEKERDEAVAMLQDAFGRRVVSTGPRETTQVTVWADSNIQTRAEVFLEGLILRGFTLLARTPEGGT